MAVSRTRYWLGGLALAVVTATLCASILAAGAVVFNFMGRQFHADTTFYAKDGTRQSAYEAGYSVCKAPTPSIRMDMGYFTDEYSCNGAELLASSMSEFGRIFVSPVVLFVSFAVGLAPVFVLKSISAKESRTAVVAS